MKTFIICRTISLVTTAAVLLPFIFLDSADSCTPVLLGIGGGTTILMMTSRKGGNGKSLVPIAIMASLIFLALTAILIKYDMSSLLEVMLYSLAVLVPLATHMIVDVFHATSDVDFLSERIQGWELAVAMVEYTHTFIFSSFSIFSYAVASLFCHDWGWGGILLCVLNFLLMAYTYLRHAAVYGTDSQLSLRQRMKRKIRYLLSLTPSREIAINYKMLYARMTEYMERKKPFLSPNFCLDELARSMYTNSGYISRVINSCTGGNFSQFVNTYRVNYAMELFKKDNTLKVHELSQLSGFSTKVTFNMAFKLVTNETPGEWCRHYLESTPQGKALSNLKVQQK